MLRIKEIPPLEIFYNPQHQVEVKRERKKRGLNQSHTLFPSNASFEVLWKGSTTAPTEELGRLTKFTGAYGSATIDKAINVQNLLKEKEENISMLEQNTEAEKQKITEHW